MDMPIDHAVDPYTEAGFRERARRGLLAAPSEALFDQRSGRALGPSDWDLNPEFAGDLALMPPTYLTSMEVGEHGSPEEVLAVASSRSVEMFTPSVEPLGSGWTLSMPDRLRPLVAARRRA